MTRPPWEVADIIRRAGDKFLERYCDSLTWSQLKVLRAIARCRTAALGGHRDQCLGCGHQAISYNSCRNRHCPKCQTNAREKWLCARRRELLPVGYFHLVFSVPHALVPLIYLESSPPLGGWRSRHLSLEGLRASQYVPCHDPDVRRVPAPVLAACSAQGSSTHPLLWLARSSPPPGVAAALPEVISGRTSAG